jgi:dephospho-CoA kinase
LDFGLKDLKKTSCLSVQEIWDPFSPKSKQLRSKKVMVFAVGLTGNIASGKTTAARIFSSFGVDVINADTVARELTTINTEAYKKIIAHYGPNLVLSNGEINRRTLRNIIFSDAKERKWLENLLHPLIRKELAHRVESCLKPYCIVEIPLLIDKLNYPYINKILVISAPPHIQITRVMERDQCSKKQAEAILSAQPDIKLRLKNADNIINNDSDFDTLKHSLEVLHSQYINWTFDRKT